MVNKRLHSPFLFKKGDFFSKNIEEFSKKM